MTQLEQSTEPVVVATVTWGWAAREGLVLVLMACVRVVATVTWGSRAPRRLVLMAAELRRYSMEQAAHMRQGRH